MIAVLPYVIHPKTAVLGRAGGGVKTIEERLGEKGGAFLKLTYKKEAIIQSPL